MSMDQWQLDDGILPGEVVDLNAVSARTSRKNVSADKWTALSTSIHCNL